MMRILSLLLPLSLAACVAAAPPAALSPQDQNRLTALVAGKTEGAPQACLPRYRANDMTAIGNTIAFRDGSSRVWISRAQGSCELLSRPGYALVTRSFGGTGLCRGEIAQILETATGSFVGSCSLGDFVPYSRSPG